MSNPPQVQIPARLLADGVSVIGIGVMGAAYTARLSSLGVSVTIFNRTRSKAAEVARTHSNVTVAPSIADCVRASSILLVACSPTMEAIASLCNRLADGELVRNKHVVFIVDGGLPQARTMDTVLFEKGGAASLTNVSLFGAAMNVMEGNGVMNASGRARTEEGVTDLVMPLLRSFATVTYHTGGPETAALFAMGAHIAWMPLFYALSHYVAVMKKGGVDSSLALEFFQTVNRTMLEYVPFLQSAFAKGDYSVYFGSHELIRDIMDSASETCTILDVDQKLTDLMSDYHQRAMRDPELAAKSWHSVYELIDRPSAGRRPLPEQPHPHSEG
ncbi:MAG: NAD(P)-binding domain-containing protein [Longimicrobiales bacterium]|nr:NAD(P)-binding domain-containing protein [Longimicrobiales bacterium]